MHMTSTKEKYVRCRRFQNSVAAKKFSQKENFRVGALLKMSEAEEKQAKTETSVKCMKLAQKAIYILVLFILILLLIVQIASCVEHYIIGPTYIETKIAPQHKALFPAMTICPVTAGYKAHVLQQHNISSVKDYNDGRKRNLMWSSNDTTVDQQTLFKNVTYNFDEIVKRIYIRFIKADTNGKTNTEISLTGNSTSIKEQRHRSFGRCYTFYPDARVRSLGVYYMKAYFHIDVKLYFHGPDQFLDLSGRMGYKLYRGEIMQSQITVTDIKILERELPEDEKEQSVTKTCSKEVYDDCIYGMLARVMRENTDDNCTVPYIRDDSKICTKPKDINTTFWVAWNRVTNQMKDCTIPCRSATVNLGAKNYVNKTIDVQDYALLYLYYAPRVTQSVEHWLYTILSLFAEIGGYVGLILGYSLFNLASWISDAIETKISKTEGPSEKKVNKSNENGGGRRYSWTSELAKGSVDKM